MSAPFDDLYALSDAARLWEKDDSTLRRAILNGKLLEGKDCKKFGKQWVVTKAAMIREYGEPESRGIVLGFLFCPHAHLASVFYTGAPKRKSPRIAQAWIFRLAGIRLAFCKKNMGEK